MSDDNLASLFFHLVDSSVRYKNEIPYIIINVPKFVDFLGIDVVEFKMVWWLDYFAWCVLDFYRLMADEGKWHLLKKTSWSVGKTTVGEFNRRPLDRSCSIHLSLTRHAFFILKFSSKRNMCLIQSIYGLRKYNTCVMCAGRTMRKRFKTIGVSSWDDDKKWWHIVVNEI